MAVKLTDVAREAGVGYGTASRALSGRGAVDEATRSHVVAVAERLGYRTHAAARALRERRTRTVGLIVPDIVNEFYTASADILQTRLDAAGYQLVVATSGNRVDREHRAVQSMLDRQVDAIVHVPVDPRIDFPAGLPVIELNRRGVTGRPAVLSDDVAGVHALTEHVIERGYTDIVAICGPESVSTSVDRGRGFLDAVGAAGFEDHPGASRRFRTVTTDYSVNGGDAAMAALAGCLPQAVVALSSRIVLGALRASQRLGVAIPDDLALAGYGDPDWFDVWSRGITTFAPALAQMGARAAELTLTLLDGGEPPTTPHVHVAGQLLVRSTTPGRAS